MLDSRVSVSLFDKKYKNYVSCLCHTTLNAPDKDVPKKPLNQNCDQSLLL